MGDRRSSPRDGPDPMGGYENGDTGSLRRRRGSDSFLVVFFSSRVCARTRRYSLFRFSRRRITRYPRRRAGGTVGWSRMFVRSLFY